VPFAAVTSFNDPSVGFGLQFGADDEADNDEEAGDEIATNAPEDETKSGDAGGSAEVVSLDSFRKSPS
jgi:hypothetical protein